ncbi:hypothetical protein C8F01DRAFT_205491 [Mycena amicta]|nr:hypothetical protein C8F01DRAFT_205491 [Mycena amicta]
MQAPPTSSLQAQAKPVVASSPISSRRLQALALSEAHAFSNFPSPWTSTHIDSDGWEWRVDSTTWLGGLGDAQGYIGLNSLKIHFRAHISLCISRNCNLHVHNSTVNPCPVRVHMWPSVRQANTSNKGCWTEEWCYDSRNSAQNAIQSANGTYRRQFKRYLKRRHTVQSVCRCREQPSYITNVKRGTGTAEASGAEECGAVRPSCCMHIKLGPETRQ